MKHGPLAASFVLFIVLCASVAYWAMQLFKPPLRAVVAPPPSAQVAPNLDAAAGLFGGRSTVAVASNFQLRGVVASGSPDDSVAILSADGKPAQAVRANSEVAPGVIVKEVHRQYVLLSDHGVIKKVELPEEAASGGNMTVSSRSTVPARTAPGAPTTPTAPTAPPRVVVSPPSQAQQAAPSNRGAPQPQSPVPNTAVPQTQPAVPVPNVPAQPANAGSTGVPANTGAAPSMDMGGSSRGYNPAGSQMAPPPPQAPVSPQTQGSMQRQTAPLTPPVPQSQATQQTQQVPQTQTAPVAPAAPQAQ